MSGVRYSGEDEMNGIEEVKNAAHSTSRYMRGRSEARLGQARRCPAMRRGECGCVAATREVHSDTRRPGEEGVGVIHRQTKQYDAVCLERNGLSE